MTDEELAAIEARNTAAQNMVSDLCQGRRDWMMSIPARPDHDPDLVIGISQRDVPALIAEIRRLRGQEVHHA
jgi:hypothetical protein